MEILLAVYLTIAGVFAAAQGNGIKLDDTKLRTYQFEARAAEKSGDMLKVGYIHGRLAQWNCEEKGE